MFDTVTLLVECEESTEKYGRFVAEPLERGFGVTVGNALRRVLLSSLTGAAVTWLQIEGIQHEFSSIPYMKEDAIEFLLNVKALRLRPLFSGGGKLFLEVVGEGEVRAGDIKPSADFEIVNPELHLATLDSPEARLIVEFNVEQGTGYVPAGQSEGLPVGAIPVDAIFTPIRKVNYTTERTGVGGVARYERMILEVWTDGTISPLDAVSRSAHLLVEQFQLFYDLARTPVTAGDKQPSPPIPMEQYNIPIEQLNLSVRTYNCLKRAGMTKAGELLEKSEKELLDIRNFGQKALEEVRERLISMGLILEKDEDEQTGMEPDEEEQSEEDLYR